MKYTNPDGGIFQGTYVQGKKVRRGPNICPFKRCPSKLLGKTSKKEKSESHETHLSSNDTCKYHERPFWVVKSQIEKQNLEEILAKETKCRLQWKILFFSGSWPIQTCVQFFSVCQYVASKTSMCKGFNNCSTQFWQEKVKWILACLKLDFWNTYFDLCFIDLEMVLKITNLLLFVLTHEYMYSHTEGTNNYATDQVLVFNGLWGKWGKRQTCESGHATKVNISEVPIMWLFLWLFVMVLSGRFLHKSSWFAVQTSSRRKSGSQRRWLCFELNLPDLHQWWRNLQQEG